MRAHIRNPELGGFAVSPEVAAALAVVGIPSAVENNPLHSVLRGEFRRRTRCGGMNTMWDKKARARFPEAAAGCSRKFPKPARSRPDCVAPASEVPAANGDGQTEMHAQSRIHCPQLYLLFYAWPFPVLSGVSPLRIFTACPISGARCGALFHAAALCILRDSAGA